MLWSKLEFGQIPNLSSQNWNSVKFRICPVKIGTHPHPQTGIPILAGQIRNLTEFQF